MFSNLIPQGIEIIDVQGKKVNHIDAYFVLNIDYFLGI